MLVDVLGKKGVLMRLTSKIEEAINAVKLHSSNHVGHTVLTTSCGATSALLIDLVSRSGCSIPVVFVDTGFMFKETVSFFYELKKRYTTLFFIRLKNENNKQAYFKQHNSGEIENTNRCCHDNKITVLDTYIEANGIQCWISALRKEQTQFRSKLGNTQMTSKGVLKLFPLIEWTEQDVKEYMKLYGLPYNPLVYKGFESIGCEPCTSKGTGRCGRWLGAEKTECGLHFSS